MSMVCPMVIFARLLNMEKVVRDGKVAVLVSPDYGAGWYSWNQDYPQCLYDPDVVSWVENGKQGTVPDLEEKYNANYFYDGGAQDLKIVWVPIGAKFRIQEYDGSESLILESEEEWLTA